MGKCGKIPYSSRQTVLDAISGMRKTGHLKKGAQTKVYNCHHCDGWHWANNKGYR